MTIQHPKNNDNGNTIKSLITFFLTAFGLTCSLVCDSPVDTCQTSGWTQGGMNTQNYIKPFLQRWAKQKAVYICPFLKKLAHISSLCQK